MPVEIIMFKVPEGTKAKLRQLSSNVSELLREQIQRLFQDRAKGSVHERSGRLVIKDGRRDMATPNEYLKQYGQSPLRWHSPPAPALPRTLTVSSPYPHRR